MADAFDELDFEYVSGVAEKAMGSLTGQRVPPTPHNFHVWFRYALGTPVALKRTIDILIANKRKFDAATNYDLYTTYVGSKGLDEAVAHQVSQQLHDVLASAQKFLSTAMPTTAPRSRRSIASPAAPRPAPIRTCWSRP